MTEVYDLIIIGGGPAGLSAGVYAGRARLNTLLLEKSAVGGRAFTTREIVNYPGCNNTTGPALTKAMAEHAEAFGTVIKKEEVKSVDFSHELKIVKTRRNEYQAKAVIIATGTESRVLGIPGEKELTGSGVAYCATCDAEFFQDQVVYVVGSGDQAIEESLYIAKFASEVHIVVLHEQGVLDCNKQAAEKAYANPKLSFIWESVLSEITGEDEVTGVKVKNTRTGEITDCPCQGVFFFVGMIPGTKCLRDSIALDDRGWVHTGERMETSVSGVFAVGDVRDKYLRQVSTAIGDGAIAATAAERYIEEQEDFQRSVVEADRPVLLGFWSQEFIGSFELLATIKTANEALGEKYKFIEVDALRRRDMVQRFAVTLDAQHTARVLLLEHGQLVRELDLSQPLR